jgi:hypothetical protein
MTVALLIEGKTEKAFLPHLRRFLETRLTGRMPRLDPVPYDGRLPRGEKLRRDVERLLSDGPRAADAVIALTDVYTGTREFENAGDAKEKMCAWVGNDRFYPHAAQYEFEAWLLPFWSDIQRIAGHNAAAPGGPPEGVNHQYPPSARIKDIFRAGNRGRAYIKVRDAGRILSDKDLLVSANACPELKAFLNTILTFCGGEPIR